MERRKFSREFKLEAVRLVQERGVAVAQAARDLDLHENVLRKWVREQAADPQQAFPGKGQMKPEQLEMLLQVGVIRKEIYPALVARFAETHERDRAEKRELANVPPASPSEELNS